MKVNYQPSAIVSNEDIILKVAEHPDYSQYHEMLLTRAYAANIDWKYIDNYVYWRKKHYFDHSEKVQTKLMASLNVLCRLLKEE